MNTDFEELYIAARKKEGRLYSADQVRKLPGVPKSDPHHWEWNLRRNSADRFTSYLGMEGFASLLEVGCGNGWFCNYILENTYSHIQPGKLQEMEVSGQDINKYELGLACKAFQHERLSWIEEDVLKLSGKKFDIIILNSSIHYFPDLKKLITHLNGLLQPEGEIHIMDSPFYRTANEQKAARQRTISNYSALGFPELSAFYTPHLYSDLDEFSPCIMYDPNGFAQKIKKLLRVKNSPFPWFRIRKR